MTLHHSKEPYKAKAEVRLWAKLGRDAVVPYEKFRGSVFGPLMLRILLLREDIGSKLHKPKPSDPGHEGTRWQLLSSS